MGRSATLVIMAAGMGSRFGGGIKQLEAMGPNGEIIMDYSIYDAVKAGFNKVVFVTRRDLLETFKEVIGNRIAKVIPVEYALQEIEDVPEGYCVPSNRTKPWGTGQAILACKDIVKEPFAVINADDYYGKEAFDQIYHYLTKEHESDKKYDFCMAGFILKNTLSANGGVTRGICVLDEQKKLVSVNETSGIVRTQSGVICDDGSGSTVSCDEESYVSMNMWGLTPDFFEELEKGFRDFLFKLEKDDVKSEYLLPRIIDDMIKRNVAEVTLLETHDKWFGVTYKEDKPLVVDSISKLIAEGKYPGKLFESNVQP